ncbi:unnamed protein product [Plutella xylostella]|uniref:(diamondback moth) hypothetical protein n=1 Tax=Plutella xylostella TaxID=51655 RepID=A0A8S4FYS1_PLUXY|nr:unnamed protein product [Plutella xylostella]
MLLGHRHSTQSNGSAAPSPARDVSRDAADFAYGRFDASALHIAHALKQTELQKAYHRPKEKPIDCYLPLIASSHIPGVADLIACRYRQRRRWLKVEEIKARHNTRSLAFLIQPLPTTCLRLVGRSSG